MTNQICTLRIILLFGLMKIFLLGLPPGVEAGERAQMLPLDYKALRDINNIPGSENMDSSLRAILAKMKARNMTRQNARELGASSLSNRLVKVNEEGSIQTYIHVLTFGPEERAQLESNEVIIEIVNEKLRIIQAWIPFNRIYEIARLPFVKRIKAPSYATPRVGSVTTEGDTILRADEIRALGYDGSGVKVGVISNGVDHLASAQAINDLPPNITIQTYAGSDDEGTAMLEIVHDLAPGAELGFCGGFGANGTTLEMIRCVNDLAGVFGADIIVDDLGFFEEPYFEDGPVAQAVANVLPQVLYISAAGNDAERHYQGQYVDSEDGMGSHQISPGNYSFNVIGEEVTVSVQWSNEFDQSGDNYDLCLSTETPEVCASFNDYQDGDDTPIEYATFNCPSGCSLQVRLVSGSPQTLELFFIGGMLVTADQVSTDSIFGHPAVPGVLAIAAIDAYDTGNDDIETFSSRGPSQIFFPSHEIRQKPDVSAIDGVSVTGAGGFPSPFFGTSAAAPHVAGVAALLKAKSTRASNIVNALKNTAVDLGPSGTDNIFGAGRIDAFAAAQYLNQPTVKTMPWIPLLLLDDGGGGEDTIQNGNFESGSTAWTEYSTGGWDIIGTSFPGTVAPHSGSYAAWLGGAYDDTKYIRQTVAVPSSSPTLTFYHWIASAESGCNYDFAYVRVNGSNQLTLGLCSSNNTGGWVPRSINLSGYAGQNISLEFRSVTNSSLNSNWFIDDVSFQ